MEYHYSNHLIVPKIENPFDFDWLYHEHPLGNLLLDFQPFESLETFVDHDQSNLLPLSSQYHDQLPRIDFQDFEDFGGAFSLDFDHAFSHPNCEDTMVDEKPQTKCVTSFLHDNQHQDMNKMNMINPTSSTTDQDNKCSEFPRMTTMIESEVFAGTNCGKLRSYKRSTDLELDDIQKYFDLPIKEAAKELHVGVTRLKRRCRELNITRWPHRKLKSLQYLISNVKQMGLDSEEIRILEEHKRLLEEVPDMELTEKTKKLRQACFKANYKNKRSLAKELTLHSQKSSCQLAS